MDCHRQLYNSTVLFVLKISVKLSGRRSGSEGKTAPFYMVQIGR